MEKERNQRKVARRYKEDIAHLTAYYGDLYSLEGHQIKSTLQEFGKICEREQLKIAAYQGLTSYLQKNYSLTLHLTSRKTKK